MGTSSIDDRTNTIKYYLKPHPNHSTTPPKPFQYISDTTNTNASNSTLSPPHHHTTPPHTLRMTHSNLCRPSTRKGSRSRSTTRCPVPRVTEVLKKPALHRCRIFLHQTTPMSKKEGDIDKPGLDLIYQNGEEPESTLWKEVLDASCK